MGVEVRMVPPNWEHPKMSDGKYQQMSGTTWPEARKDSIDDCEEHNGGLSLCENCYLGEGDREYYSEEWPEGYATWFQLYQTVSEGTPLTPPFETEEEIVDYLVENGDFWGRTMTRQQAEGMVEDGGACSAVMCDGKMHGPYEQSEL